MKICFYNGDDKILLSEADESQKQSRMGKVALEIEKIILHRPFLRNIFSFPEIYVRIWEEENKIAIEVFIEEHDDCNSIVKGFKVPNPFIVNGRFEIDSPVFDKWKSVLYSMFHMEIM